MHTRARARMRVVDTGCNIITSNYVQTQQHVHDYPRVDNPRCRVHAMKRKKKKEEEEEGEEERSILRLLHREPGGRGSIGEAARWRIINQIGFIRRGLDRRAERGQTSISTRVASFRGRAVFSNVFFIAT